MGSPVICRDNVWDVYLTMRSHFYRLEGIRNDFEAEWHSVLTQACEEGEACDAGVVVELLSDLRALHNGLENCRPDGSYYMGGVNSGRGLGIVLLIFHWFPDTNDTCLIDHTHQEELNDMLRQDEPALDGENDTEWR
jgi:hypothetical protein